MFLSVRSNNALLWIARRKNALKRESNSPTVVIDEEITLAGRRVQSNPNNPVKSSVGSIAQTRVQNGLDRILNEIKKLEDREEKLEKEEKKTEERIKKLEKMVSEETKDSEEAKTFGLKDIVKEKTKEKRKKSFGKSVSQFFSSALDQLTGSGKYKPDPFNPPGEDTLDIAKDQIMGKGPYDKDRTVKELESLKNQIAQLRTA